MIDVTADIIETDLGLELDDFKIDSEGWSEFVLADGARVKANPERDVTELLEGEFAGQQYFTWHAAMRETANAGKRMPTEQEWFEIIRMINPKIDPLGGWQEDVSVREALKLKIAGYRFFTSLEYSDQGNNGYYWTSSHSGSYGYLYSISKRMIGPLHHGMSVYGFSVRCVTD
jgi:uncharacterized protein (TIGR02145 family)